MSSCKSSINNLLSIVIGKAGDSLFKRSCSSNLEGVGKPFMLKKGWKQKHESANIEKQGQMFCFFLCLVLVMVLNVEIQ